MTETPNLADRNPILFGTFYPEDFVVAVVDDRAQAEAAISAVGEAGVPQEDVILRSGEAVLANHRAFPEQRNVLQRMGSLIPSEAADALQEYLAEAEQDRTFVAAHAPERDQRDRVVEILRRHSGHAIRYYGSRTSTNLG